MDAMKVMKSKITIPNPSLFIRIHHQYDADDDRQRAYNHQGRNLLHEEKSSPEDSPDDDDGFCRVSGI